MKNQSNKKLLNLFSAIFIFIIFAGFVFFSSVYSATAQSQAQATPTIQNNLPSNGMYVDKNGNTVSPNATKQTQDGRTIINDNGQAPVYAIPKSGPGGFTGDSSKNNDPCGSPGSYVLHPIACPLLDILKIDGWLLAMSTKIFAWVVDANKLSQVIDNDAIYQSWATVRDFLNIAFILVLLYAAFSIIFQVGGKFGEKKIILKIVLMALLVNFSYPITRFIIDVSNSLMYTILNKFFGAYANNPEEIITKMPAFDSLKNIIVPPNGTGATVSQLIASVIFVFILALTILSMAVLLLIRIIALAIIIIFSPVAFVGSILGKGGQWWDYLFKYAFFGPIMAFMLALAIQIMNAMINLDFTTSTNFGQSVIQDQSIITAMSKFAIPIVVLWIGMGVAQKMGIAGAAQVTGAAKGIAKWVGKRASGYSWAKKQYNDYVDIKKKEREERLKNTPHLVDRTLARLGDKKAQERIKKKHIAANKEDIKKEEELNAGTTASSLHAQIQADKARSSAAALPGGTPLTHKEKIAAAGRVKAAMASGKEYEKEIEKEAKTDFQAAINPATGLANGIKPPERLIADIETDLPIIAMQNAINTMPTSNASEIQLRQEAIQKREKEITKIKEANKKAIADYEKGEKKMIEETKEKAFEQNRKTIAEAEASKKP